MKYVIFSFDDGRNDQYEIGYKVLKEYGFPATINVVSSFVDLGVGDFDTIGNKAVLWDEVVEMANGGWEIACHGAEHDNSVEGAFAWLGNESIIKNGWNEAPGFASPGSGLTESNCDEIRRLAKDGKLSYIRSGKQTRREGLWYIVKTVVNRYLKSRRLFVAMNRDCILKASDREKYLAGDKIIMSVGITAYDTADEVKALIDEVRDDEAVILMMHSIVDDAEARKATDRWYWETSKLREVCEYISRMADVRVVTTREWLKM